MLAESIIRIGRPIKDGGMPCREKIRLLTDVSSENCKNFFRHVFLIELAGESCCLQHIELGDRAFENNKETFTVNSRRSVAFPIFYPNGGNPLHAQGIYPLPCYLLYDPHLKALGEKEQFKKEFLSPRLNNTLQYRDRTPAEKELLADQVAALLADQATAFISEDKQLGILMIYDAKLNVFQHQQDWIGEDATLMWINESRLQPGRQLYLDGEKVLQCISQAKFYEAAELGYEKDAVSTFSNQQAAEVVSIYNKAWLWLSPTWDMPRSIYWQDDEWTKGIKMDAESYAAYFYGVQFLKEIQVPVASAVLKEMFAPVTSVEAKRNMKATSFEAIYGIPLVLPLTDGDSQQLFANYRRMLKKDSEKQSNSDLHLKVLAGIDRVVPRLGDEHRLTILYYSGDLSRGNMHIRAVIEDIIPSVAGEIERILHDLRVSETPNLQQAFGVARQEVYKTQTLPALLANAFGPGYVWETLQAVLHKEPLRIERLQLTTARRLNELANKEDSWQMVQELIFYYGFLYFLHHYEQSVLQKQGSVRILSDWNEFRALYSQGRLEVCHLASVEQLGFAAGLLLRQFHNSYYQKTGKEFVKQRVMKFGSKLTPVVIWKNGLLRCEELAQQWNMNLGANFRPVLAQALLGFLEKQDQLVPEKDSFMTAFWSGYLLYKKNDKTEEDGGNDNEQQ